MFESHPGKAFSPWTGERGRRVPRTSLVFEDFRARLNLARVKETILRDAQSEV